MSDRPSPVTSEVEFDAPGRSAGYLRVPHSVDRSAYGWVGVPVVVLSGGSGPTILMLAGVHGDEYEGQVALASLARRLDPATLRGRLILLPAANAPAAEAGTRVSPIDGGNLNRAFPGAPRGGPTAIIADYIEKVLMPLADICVDLHSGGASLIYPPTLLRGEGANAEEAAMLQRFEAALDLPYAWVFSGGGGRGSTAPTVMGAANRAGVTCVMAELGGAATLTPEVLRRTERGLDRLLRATGLRAGEVTPPDGTRRLRALGSIYAYETGVLEPLKGLIDPVAEGEVVARLHRPDTPLAPPMEVTSPWHGLVLARRAQAEVRRGDALMQIAGDVD